MKFVTLLMRNSCQYIKYSLVISSILFFSLNSYSQFPLATGCTVGSNSYTSVSAPTTSFPTAISTVVNHGNYFTVSVNSSSLNNIYRVTLSSGEYITIKAPNGTIVASGYSPLIFTATMTGNYTIYTHIPSKGCTNYPGGNYTSIPGTINITCLTCNDNPLPPPPPNELCKGATTFCLDENGNSPSVTLQVNAGSATDNTPNTDKNTGSGNGNYGCFYGGPGIGTAWNYSVDNPSWFYVQTDAAGQLQFNINAASYPSPLNSGDNTDISLLMWGPFTSVDAAINNCPTLPTPTVCYGVFGGNQTATQTIPVNINPVQANQVYLMLIPNSNNYYTQINISSNDPNIAKPEPKFNPLGPYCLNSTPGTLPTTSLDGITGTWSPSTVNTSTTGSVEYTFTPTTGQCAKPTKMTIVVNPKVTPTFNPIAPFCEGTTAPTLPTASTNSPAISGTWSPATISNTASGTYNFTPATTECANPASLSVTVNSKITPTFDPIAPFCEGTTAPVLPTSSTNSPAISGTWSPATVSNTTSDTYNFTPATTECANPASLSVTVNPKITPTFNPIAPFCEGTTAPTLPTASTNSPAISGTWSPATVSNTTSGTYNFTPAASECATTQTSSVTVNPLPNINAGPDQTICLGATATISASGGVTYNWQGLNNNSNQTVTPDSTATYTVTGTDANGCTNTDEVTINVMNQLDVPFTVDTTAGCSPLSTQFSAPILPGVEYSWDFGDGKTSSDPNPSHTFYNDTCFTISLTLDNGQCSFTKETAGMICVHPTPDAEFTASTYTISPVVNEVTFNNTSTDANHYEWNFGDGTGHSTQTSPAYTYDPNKIGNYTVKLYAINEFGCIDSSLVALKMDNDVVFYVPNTFTPDGDQYNNIFKPVFSEGYDAFDYQLLIFDRWGEIIFETHDINVGWDGTYLVSGKICQDGVYVWKIDIKRKGSSDKIERLGHVTLLR